MEVIAAGKGKNGFGFLIDTARAEPVTIQKHGRAVAVVLSVEEYERLKSLQLKNARISRRRSKAGGLRRESVTELSERFEKR